MTMVDLEPAATRVAELVSAVADEQLDGPTPCVKYALGDLLEHIGGLAVAFTAAAEKSGGDATGPPPAGDASRLGDDWRTRIPRDLATLAEAWRDPAAWTGMTRAGGIEMPGEVAGVVALNELVVHGWDVARATGQEYDVDRSSLETSHGFVQQFSGPDHDEMRGDAFGPVVDASDNAPLLDRLVALTGRDPNWSPG